MHKKGCKRFFTAFFIEIFAIYIIRLNREKSHARAYLTRVRDNISLFISISLSIKRKASSKR